jgi:MurNAc alpha-1-phosphate uridylyltransferase
MPTTPDAVMLFAAGFGTRMQPLTHDRPKPLIPVAGRPLIDHALSLTGAVSPRVVVANLHYKAQMLVDHLTPLGVQTIIEKPEILDTGGGLRNALPLLGEGPVFTLNTDAIWVGPNCMTLLSEAWDPDKMDALLMCVPIERAIGRKGTGDFDLSPDGQLSRGEPYVYCGAQIIKTDLIETVPEAAFSLNVIWNKMREQNRLYGLSYPGSWCDIGHPEGIALAETFLSSADV